MCPPNILGRVGGHTVILSEGPCQHRTCQTISPDPAKGDTHMRNRIERTPQETAGIFPSLWKKTYLKSLANPGASSGECALLWDQASLFVSLPWRQTCFTETYAPGRATGSKSISGATLRKFCVRTRTCSTIGCRCGWKDVGFPHTWNDTTAISIKKRRRRRLDV